MDAPSKAEAADLGGRFREIVSDPLNLVIPRCARAGCVEDGLVVLHNGLRVPTSGSLAYYGDFSAVLVINRGVHEPLEEFVFHALLSRLPADPAMLELGAYWGHYSMWLKSVRPAATVHLVEPEAANLEAGRLNFERNGLQGTFEQARVAAGEFTVDGYLARSGLARLDVLHTDIQGDELQMLAGASRALSTKAVDHVFLSTHSQDLHARSVEALARHGYRVEVSADFDTATTSYDGFVYASRPDMPLLLSGFRPLTRVAITRAGPAELARYVAEAAQVC
jgi:hypothetical protein